MVSALERFHCKIKTVISTSCALFATSAIFFSNFPHSAGAFFRRMWSIHILAQLQYSPQTSKCILCPRSTFSFLYLMGWFSLFRFLTFLKWDSFSLFEYFLYFIEKGDSISFILLLEAIILCVPKLLLSSLLGAHNCWEVSFLSTWVLLIRFLSKLFFI